MPHPAVQVLPGDIVVLGSDGLFDNVSDGEVVTIAEQLLRENCCTPSELARCLLHNAYHNSLDRSKVRLKTAWANHGAFLGVVDTSSRVNTIGNHRVCACACIVEREKKV